MDDLKGMLLFQMIIITSLLTILLILLVYVCILVTRDSGKQKIQYRRKDRKSTFRVKRRLFPRPRHIPNVVEKGDNHVVEDSTYYKVEEVLHFGDKESSSQENVHECACRYRQGKESSFPQASIPSANRYVPQVVQTGDSHVLEESTPSEVEEVLYHGEKDADSKERLTENESAYRYKPDLTSICSHTYKKTDPINLSSESVDEFEVDGREVEMLPIKVKSDNQDEYIASVDDEAKVMVKNHSTKQEDRGLPNEMLSVSAAYLEVDGNNGSIVVSNNCASQFLSQLKSEHRSESETRHNGEEEMSSIDNNYDAVTCNDGENNVATGDKTDDSPTHPDIEPTTEEKGDAPTCEAEVEKELTADESSDAPSSMTDDKSVLTADKIIDARTNKLDVVNNPIAGVTDDAFTGKTDDESVPTVDESIVAAICQTDIESAQTTDKDYSPNADFCLSQQSLRQWAEKCPCHKKKIENEKRSCLCAVVVLQEEEADKCNAPLGDNFSELDRKSDKFLLCSHQNEDGGVDSGNFSRSKYGHVMEASRAIPEVDEDNCVGQFGIRLRPNNCYSVQFLKDDNIDRMKDPTPERAKLTGFSKNVFAQQMRDSMNVEVRDRVENKGDNNQEILEDDEDTCCLHKEFLDNSIMKRIWMMKKTMWMKKTSWKVKMTKIMLMRKTMLIRQASLSVKMKKIVLMRQASWRVKMKKIVLMRQALLSMKMKETVLMRQASWRVKMKKTMLMRQASWRVMMKKTMLIRQALLSMKMKETVLMRQASWRVKMKKIVLMRQASLRGKMKKTNVDKAGIVEREDEDDSVDEAGILESEDKEDSVDEAGIFECEDKEDSVDEAGIIEGEDKEDSVDEAGIVEGEDKEDSVDEAGIVEGEDKEDSVDEAGIIEGEDEGDSVDEAGIIEGEDEGDSDDEECSEDEEDMLDNEYEEGDSLISIDLNDDMVSVTGQKSGRLECLAEFDTAEMIEWDGPLVVQSSGDAGCVTYKEPGTGVPMQDIISPNEKVTRRYHRDKKDVVVQIGENIIFNTSALSVPLSPGKGKANTRCPMTTRSSHLETLSVLCKSRSSDEENGVQGFTVDEYSHDTIDGLGTAAEYSHDTIDGLGTADTFPEPVRIPGRQDGHKNGIDYTDGKCMVEFKVIPSCSFLHKLCNKQRCHKYTCSMNYQGFSKMTKNIIPEVIDKDEAFTCGKNCPFYPVLVGKVEDFLATDTPDLSTNLHRHSVLNEYVDHVVEKLNDLLFSGCYEDLHQIFSLIGVESPSVSVRNTLVGSTSHVLELKNVLDTRNDFIHKQLLMLIYKKSIADGFHVVVDDFNLMTRIQALK